MTRELTVRDFLALIVIVIVVGLFIGPLVALVGIMMMLVYPTAEYLNIEVPTMVGFFLAMLTAWLVWLGWWFYLLEKMGLMGGLVAQ